MGGGVTGGQRELGGGGGGLSVSLGPGGRPAQANVWPDALSWTDH